MNIDWWDKETTHILINPRTNQDQQDHTRHQLMSLGIPGHLWIASSGSSAISGTAQKWAALSKEALLISAEAVNHHLHSDANDIWLHALPDFHVGGIGIWVRAAISGASVIDLKQKQGDKWNSILFHQEAHNNNATLTALVPAQLYDLVTHQLRAPSTLRASIIGGGALNQTLYQQAKALGWNPLPSYGLTECCSQVATAPLESLTSYELTPPLKTLPHVRLQLTTEKKLCISSPSLLTTYAWIGDTETIISNEIKDGWFETEDIADIQGEYLIVYGRGSDFIKIGGESVDLQRLNLLLQQILAEHQITAESTIVPISDQRLGHLLYLVTTNTRESEIAPVIESYHRQTLPYERIRQIVKLPFLPKTALGKIKRQELVNIISLTSQDISS